MSRMLPIVGLAAIGLAAILPALLATTAQAQQPQQPPFAATKVEGTENIYIFRFGGHQSMLSSRPPA